MCKKFGDIFFKISALAISKDEKKKLLSCVMPRQAKVEDRRNGWRELAKRD